MELIKAHTIATELIKKHCPNYTFKFDNAKVRFGRCSYIKKEISISKYLTYLNSEEEVLDTIKHEIAHALTKGENHNKIWRAKAISLGCNGDVCYNGKDVKHIKGKFVYQCCACNKKIYRHRKLKNKSACKECCKLFNNNKFSNDYLLVFLGVRC